MPKNSEPKLTYLYELLISFSGRDLRLVHHVEEKDRDRMLGWLGDDFDEHGFYQLGGHEGHECIVNTAHVTRLNILDYLAGAVQFQAEPKRSEKESERRLEEREAADAPIILRIWLRGETEPDVHYEVEHASWLSICLALDAKSKFIEFFDEDRESVLYGTDHLDAIEMIDPFYLKDEQVDELLKRYDEESDETLPEGAA